MADRLRRAAAVEAFACMSLADWAGSPTTAEVASQGADEGYCADTLC